MSTNLDVKGALMIVIILFLLGWMGFAINTLYDFQSQKQAIQKHIQENIQENVKIGQQLEATTTKK